MLDEYMRKLAPGDKMVMSYQKSQKPSWQGANASQPPQGNGGMNGGQPPPYAPMPMPMRPPMDGPPVPASMLPGGDPGAYASSASAPAGPDPRERLMLMQAMRRRFGGGM